MSRAEQAAKSESQLRPTYTLTTTSGDNDELISSRVSGNS